MKKYDLNDAMHSQRTMCYEAAKKVKQPKPLTYRALTFLYIRNIAVTMREQIRRRKRPSEVMRRV